MNLIENANNVNHTPQIKLWAIWSDLKKDYIRLADNKIMTYPSYYMAYDEILSIDPTQDFLKVKELKI